MKSKINKLTRILSSLTILLIVHSTFNTDNCLCQVTQEWIARYNGPGNNLDVATSIAVDASGNVYVTGRIREIWTTFYDYATIKYNSSGVQQWIQIYNGPANSEDWATSIAVDASGNVYVTGRSTGSGTGYDYATIKYNSSGVQQWIQIYNGLANADDVASSLAIDASGNVYVTGGSTESGVYHDIATIKYNSSGVQQWVQTYNGPANSDDGASSLAIDASGNVYVTGGSTGSGTGKDYATIKYNSSGVQQWVQTYNGFANGDDGASSLAIDASGNVYVTGGSIESGVYPDYATIKYNSSGVQQWVQTYNGPANGLDQAHSLAVDASGNVYVTGESPPSGVYPDYATIKYNSAGFQQWIQRYNGPGNNLDRAVSVAVDTSGNVYVTGVSRSGGIGTEDYATIKYNSAGVEHWIQRYNFTGSDYGNKLAIDALGNVYVTGMSTGSGTNYDYATIKYSQLVGITSISNEIPGAFRLEQNYPNPFNPISIIKYQISKTNIKNQKVKLSVFDILGKEVVVLVNAEQLAGEYEVVFDGINYPSGVYYYQLKTDEFIETKKMILIK